MFFAKEKCPSIIRGHLTIGYTMFLIKSYLDFFNNRIQKGRKGKRENGGAYKCYKYARELGVQIVNIADKIHNEKQ